jgi:hypothetical protein
MSDNVSNEMSNTVNSLQEDSRWNVAIDDANEEIKLLKTNVKRLESAVRIFQQNKRSGVKWPEPSVNG